MLTDTTLRNLKPQSKRYKVVDRDGMYVLVSPTGGISFRYDYRLNGRRETFIIGPYYPPHRCNPKGLTLALARQKCVAAKEAIDRGESPAHGKRSAKQRVKAAKTFCDYAEDWFREADLADTTKAMRRGVYNRDIFPRFKKRVMAEITEDDIRDLCEQIKRRNAPATALHVRDVIKAVFEYAALKGLKIPNPAASIAPKAIATIKARDRALSPLEVRLMLLLLEHIQANADHRLAIRFILLTLVRKGELVKAKWTEVNFQAGIWEIPKEHMKARRPHNVYLSRQALEILTALKACAGNSPYILPARHDPRRHIAPGSLNRLTESVVEQAKSRNVSLEDFTLHDLRRTASTILNEVGFNGDWIEKCLAHEQGHSSRGVYNKAQYAEQRRHMLQEWANMLDAWCEGRSYAPVLLPPFIQTYVPEITSGPEGALQWA
jgi:integrase